MKKFLIIILLFSLFAFGCDDDKAETVDTDSSSDSVASTVLPTSAGLAVHYLDVGEGDAILIKLPDGKLMLIDCGEANKSNKSYLKSCITELGGKIDYFLLSHPDGDHAGNASFVLDEFSVGTIILPDVKNLSRFGVYGEFYQEVTEKEINVERSETGKRIDGDDYFIGFLCPKGRTFLDSPYNDLDLIPSPSAVQINSVSPIIYLECYGKRFVFTGDAPADVENGVIDNVRAGYYNHLFERQIDLQNLDFLKVSHHGSNDASSEKFLNYLKPKTAVISVGVNSYGHPTAQTLTRLMSANIDVSVYRTDTSGTVSVLVNSDGSCSIKTAIQ